MIKVSFLSLFLFLFGCTGKQLKKFGADEQKESHKNHAEKRDKQSNDLEATEGPTKKKTNKGNNQEEEQTSEEEEEKDLRKLALVDEEALHELDDGEKQIAKVCARNVGKTNEIIQAFCVNNIRPKSLIELQTALGINIQDPTRVGRGQQGQGGNPFFAFQGHSSSLVGRFTSSINPRVIVMKSNVNGRAPNSSYLLQGFVRGEQLVELIANDPVTNQPDFFLVADKVK